MNKKKGIYFTVLLVLIAVSIVFSNFSNLFYTTEQESEAETTEVVVPEMDEKVEPQLYLGIDVSALDVTQTKLKWGQSLSVVLNDFKYDAVKLSTLAKKSREVFDVRKITTGKRLSILHSKDSLKEVKHVIYEPNPHTYITYSFDDEITIKKTKKPISIKQKEMAGVIEYSLYETVLALGGSAALVDELVDVLAWQIDFFGIQKNDKFKVVYTERYVDGEAAGIEEIVTAYFESSGQPYYAYKFCQGDEEKDYFDDEGNSVRKAFLRAPLKYSRISSRYNPRRFHPVQKRYKAHLGTDYAAPVGTPIRTVGDGVVVKSTFTKNNGNFVKIKHNATYSTQYLHMSKRAKGIRRGIHVKKGQVIGYVGSTGLATGPHLCYRFWKNGVQVDALRVKLPASKPIKSEYMDEFMLTRSDQKTVIDLVPYGDTKKMEENPPLALK